MALQIFGTKKCQESKKAGRFFKERGVKYQFVDLGEKGMSPGELASVVASLGLAYLECDLAQELLADFRLMRTPIIRDGRRATVGYSPEAWVAWLAP